MEPSPVSPWVALRAALAIGLPTAVGLALEQSGPAALVALGALPAITGDGSMCARLISQRMFEACVRRLMDGRDKVASWAAVRP
jgi:hypothetical protein